MSEIKGNIRTSLEVGFTEGGLPEGFLQFRGRANRSIQAQSEFPFEDAQFEVVMVAGPAVTAAVVKEAHRVLVPAGRMFFTVFEKTKKQDGYTMSDIYSIVRYGFDIVSVKRTPWWHFRKEKMLTITARKKNWRELNNRFRPYL